jgi:hypothetical protein
VKTKKDCQGGLSHRYRIVLTKIVLTSLKDRMIARIRAANFQVRNKMSGEYRNEKDKERVDTYTDRQSDQNVDLLRRALKEMRDATEEGEK